MSRLHHGYCRTVGSSLGSPVIVDRLFSTYHILGAVISGGTAVSTRILRTLSRIFRAFTFSVLNLGRRTNNKDNHRRTFNGIISVLLRRHVVTGTGGS